MENQLLWLPLFSREESSETSVKINNSLIPKDWIIIVSCTIIQDFALRNFIRGDAAAGLG
jgi:hypothetical protein